MSSPRAVGGKLRLKGGLPANYKRRKANVDGGRNGRSQSHAEDSGVSAYENRMDVDHDEMPSLVVPESTNKTAAQLAFERQVRKVEREAPGTTATMTYRQRIDEYNRRLASMSEHHDIPKVGPG